MRDSSVLNWWSGQRLIKRLWNNPHVTVSLTASGVQVHGTHGGVRSGATPDKPTGLTVTKQQGCDDLSHSVVR